MTSDVTGIPIDKVHVMSCQDTDLTPFGTGAYASRQTYVGSFAISLVGKALKERVLDYLLKNSFENWGSASSF